MYTIICIMPFSNVACLVLKYFILTTLSVSLHCIIQSDGLFICMCLTSLQQRGHLEMAPPFTVPCEGREAR